MQTLKIDPLYLKTTPQAPRKIGIQVGDFVAFDANPEIVDNGLIVSRHLDNKAELPLCLPRLCDKHGIPSHRDVFRFYHSDAGAAVSAEHDVRTALLCFGADASHGYERTRMSVPAPLAEWLTVYIQSGPTFPEDRQRRIGSVAGFSHQLDPGQLARSETPLPDAGGPAHRRRNDDAS